jgi:hypothetical protein
VVRRRVRHKLLSSSHYAVFCFLDNGKDVENQCLPSLLSLPPLRSRFSISGKGLPTQTAADTVEGSIKAETTTQPLKEKKRTHSLAVVFQVPLRSRPVAAKATAASKNEEQKFCCVGSRHLPFLFNLPHYICFLLLLCHQCTHTQINTRVQCNRVRRLSRARHIPRGVHPLGTTVASLDAAS